ncbi:MAG: DUF4032 domain-containing protein [Candidatus Limnocylindrales bacterium]
MPFPHLRLRQPTSELLDLPWELPLDEWPAERLPFRDYDVGPSRHTVRFLATATGTIALKELPVEVGRSEFDVLRRLEIRELPAVRGVGIAEAVDRDAAILITAYLAQSLQYRRLLTRLPAGPYRDRVMDGMASLLVDLHRSGVYWGDCSLANTLFRRDGDKIQAYLVDAETSEIHPSLSDGQRTLDLDILVENVAHGLADLAISQHEDADLDEAIAAAEGVRARYLALWDELMATPDLDANDRQGIRAQVRRLNDLGFWVEEIELEPSPTGQRVRMKVAVTNRTYHARRLQRLTGLVALEGQARLLLNDLKEYTAWLDTAGNGPLTEATGARRWLDEVLQPTLRELAPLIGPERDPLQAYCDVLEAKWILSEAAGHDVGLRAAIDSYLELGAPAPEVGALEGGEV